MLGQLRIIWKKLEIGYFVFTNSSPWNLQTMLPKFQVRYVDHEVQPVFDLVVFNTTEWTPALEWS